MLITLQHNTHRKLRYFHFGCDNCGDHTEICDIVILGVIIVGITLILKYQYSYWSKNGNLCFQLKFFVLCVRIPIKPPGSLKTSALCNNQNIHKRKWRSTKRSNLGLSPLVYYIQILRYKWTFRHLPNLRRKKKKGNRYFWKKIFFQGLNLKQPLFF